MPLKAWLYTNAAISMIIGVGSLLSIGMIVLLLFNPTIPVMTIVSLYSISMVVASVFLLIWNIVGSVALFRDSMECLEVNKPIWAMVLACLIFQWIIIVCNNVGHKYKAKIGGRSDGYTEL